ncbi:MAG: DoxX family protein [Acidobacteria bacterium]|nr:DoxX family protein [Acidobacteriota bacterium]MBI3262043.1 DoxX family protein [Acidobacteriota bacterium]
MKLLASNQDRVFSIARFVIGLVWAEHGAQKLFGLLGGTQQPLMSLVGLAGVIEFFGGLLIAFGLFTSVVAFIASGEMAAAYFLNHAPNGFWPIQNRGEMAVFYCFFFLYLASRGAGVWSLDAWRNRR